MDRSNATTHTRTRGARLLVLTLLGTLLAGMALSLASCGEKTAQVPTPAGTLRPTFTSIPAQAATLEPSATLPVPTVAATATLTPMVTETVPTDEPSPTGAPVATQTPMVVTATPAPATATPQASPTPGLRTKMRSPDYGMQAFLWWRPEVAQRDLEEIHNAGFRWVKQDFAWREIEGAGKGRFDWSIADRVVAQVQSVGKLRLIVRLDSDPTWASGQTYPNAQNVIMSPPKDLQDFADFCYAVASRYEGQIGAYQIWNEPNLSREWGGKAPDPAGYVAMLKAGYQAIKRADPDALVISAGMAPTTRNDKVAMPDTQFLTRMYAAGARPYFDYLGAHGAGFKAPPEMDPADVSTDPNYYNRGDANCPGPACRIYCFRHVEDLHQISIDNGDPYKRVVVLEFGWTMDERSNSPYRWHAVTEDQQAEYFVHAYQYARDHWQPWIAVMSLIYMPDNNWTQDDEQFWWSIAAPGYPQFIPYKAYRDLAAMPK